MSRLHIPASLLACVALSFCWPEHGYAQRALQEVSSVPEATIRDGFSDIAGVRVLRDGRVLVLDVMEQRLVVADFETGKVEPIGRAGRGPGEYVRATRLIALSADSTWLVDVGQNRILVLVGTSIVGALPAFAGAAVDSGLSAASLRGADARGFVYFTGRGVSTSERGIVPADSVMLFAASRDGGTLEPLGRLAQAAASITVRKGSGSDQSVHVVRVPFVVGDEAIVDLDGTVTVARRAPYRLSVLRRGSAAVHGPTRSIPRVPVTDQDRQQYLATLSPAAAASMDAVPWPSHKPPYVTRSLASSPRGVRWIMRSGPASATTGTYDVFDATGRWIGNRAVAAGVRIAWMGESHALAVRVDEDGLNHLERYRLR
ncbi:MAG: hypothetical protein U0164_24650 [Gemmatimonadaceae bacterium]